MLKDRDLIVAAFLIFRCGVVYPAAPAYFWCFLNHLMRAFVELSCFSSASSLASSGRIFLASCLPSSTPHWS